MLKIIEANSNHTTALRRIFLNVRQKTFYWQDITKFSPDDFEIQTEGEFVIVAVMDEEVVGFISLWLPENFIHHLYIDESHQQQKVGTKLLYAAIQKMNLPITLKCLEQNTKASEFYKAKGFIMKEKGISDEGNYILYELPSQK
jgi:ribosomal protein S18 acetylase RimI-like enzyme